MERRVERRDLRHSRQGRSCGIDHFQAGRVVQRRQLGQCLDGVLDLRSDAHGGGVALAAVDDAVADGTDLSRLAQQRRRPCLQLGQDVRDSLGVRPDGQFPRTAACPSWRTFSLAGAAAQSIAPSRSVPRAPPRAG